VRLRANRPPVLRAFVLALVALGAVVAPTPAHAEAERVVLAGVPDNLADATSTVLVPWHIEIVRTGQHLTADPDQARRDARSMAARDRAGAVVWLAPTPQGPTLWVYDASSQQVLSRPLASAPPFDEPMAASVALSIKTMLRHSSVAPPAERIAAPAEPIAAPAEPIAPPAEPIAAPAEPIAPPGPRALRPYMLSARASLRLPAPPLDPEEPGVEPRLGLGATWWPAFVPGRHGVGIEVELGPGLFVSKSGFRGRFHDVTASLAVHRHITLGQWLGGRAAIVPALGLGLHITRLTGELQSERGSAGITHVIPSADAGIDVRARLSRVFEVGAGLRASLMTRTHDYEVDMRPVSSSPVFLMTLGITISVLP
jgi:hypothetical protein